MPFILLAVLLGCAGIASGQAAPVSVRAKFMTYNVQSPGWNQNRRTQVVGTSLDQQPDVLGLHEASSFRNGADLMADLAEAFEPHMTETSDPIYLRRERGIRVLEEGIETLPACSGVLGGAALLTWMKLETPEGARFDFYNVHLCVSQTPSGEGDPEGNQRQAVAVADFISVNSDPETTSLLAGDLNATQDSATILYLLRGEPLTVDGAVFVSPVELEDTWQLAPANSGLERPGTTASGGQSALDWILMNPLVEVVEAQVIRFDIAAGEESFFSDHLPVVATLEFRETDALSR